MELKMNKLIVLLFITGIANAATIAPSQLSLDNERWVTATGSDSNQCTKSKPCATLSRACTLTTIAGSTIRVGVGTINQSAVCNLNVGVNIACNKGAILRATTALEPMVEASSASQGVDGNQKITGCEFDGNTLTGVSAFRTKGRSNVILDDVYIHDFLDRGSDFHGLSTADSTNLPPIIFASGNKVINSRFVNNSRFSGYGRGNIQWGGQDGFLIQRTSINQSGRGVNGNGYAVKFLNNGYNKNTRILNNDIFRESFVGDSFAFAIESWIGLGGDEIAYNTIYPAIDYVNAESGDYKYSLWVHDNLIGHTALVGDSSGPSQRVVHGVILETNIDKVLIERNTFRNLSGNVLQMDAVTNTTKSNVTLQNNVAYNIYGGCAGNTATNTNFYNFKVLNNTFFARTGSTNDGCQVLASPMKNAEVRNNIMVGFSRAPVFLFPNSVDELIVENNNFFNNGNSNTVLKEVNTKAFNFIERNNITTNPDFSNGLGTTITAGSFVIGKQYRILSLGTTNFAGIGAPTITAGNFIVGRTYYINSVGTTSFTSIGASANTIGTIFVATGKGSGTGNAVEQGAIFTAVGVGTGTGTAVADDFRLLGTSGAIGKGADIGLYTDVNNRARYNSIDIGAHQFAPIW
jgi:hypothetical protein